MIRSVPWVAGCCGPMLRVMPSVSSSTLSAGVGGLAGDVGELLAVGQRGHATHHASVVASSSAGRHGLDVDDAGPRLHHAGQQREVLAQRVALEVDRQVDVAEVGVAGEGDAEHLPRLALVPVGAGVDVGTHDSTVSVSSGTSALSVTPDVLARSSGPGEHLEAGVAAGVRPARSRWTRSGGGSVGSSSPSP